MSEIKKVPVIPSQLQRPALTATPQTGLSLPGQILASSVITSIAAGATLTKSVTGASDRISVDSFSRSIPRKQTNPVKQTVVVAPASSNNTANPAPRTTKFSGPPPPPLIPAIPPQPSATTTTTATTITTGAVKPTQPPVRPVGEKVPQVSQPAAKTNGTSVTSSQVAPSQQQTSKPDTTTTPSSDSSSEDSSSDSSATSGEESVKAESNKASSLSGKTSSTIVVVDSEVPGPSGVSKRGRGRPRLATSTPKPVKQVKLGAQRARTTPRKKSERVPKPPVIFSPDTAGGKAALPKRRGRGCGGCAGCMREDCGKCNYCKDKTKFGGPGRKKQRCALRVCSNFVKPLHGKGRPVNPDTPPGEVAVIPVPKLASSLKVAEVIEQLRQNLTSSIPPVIDKDSLPTVPLSLSTTASKTTSFIISQPLQLKATASTLTSLAANETKIVGPVTPSTMISKITSSSSSSSASASTTAPVSAPVPVSKPGKTPEPNKQPQPKATEAPKSSDAGKKEEAKRTTAIESAKTPDTSKPTEGNKISEASKSSEIALRTRRKQQQQQQQQPQQQVKEMLSTPTSTASSASGDQDKVKCIVCGRGRKPSLMRSNQFCTQRCINAWSEKNAKGVESPLSSRRSTEVPMEVEKQATPQQQQKKLPRALKNLQIDMTWDRSSTSSTRPPPSYTPTVSATPKPTMTSTPTPTATTATNKRPTSSTGVQPSHSPAKKLTKEMEVTVGTKRPSQQQPPQNQKKLKEAEPAKSVSFNLTTIPTSTVDPISAPPLSRTVPPPSISIVPLDQLTALGTALLSQQQNRTRKEESPIVTTSAKSNNIPASLPVDVRSWTISQVVKFFESTSDCKDYAAVFREQEVDGTALLLLTHESLVKCLGIKLGRALKIMVHVEELQKLYA